MIDDLSANMSLEELKNQPISRNVMPRMIINCNTKSDRRLQIKLMLIK